MLDARTGRTRVTNAAPLRATRYGALADRERCSTLEPCPLWWIESSVINILPFKTTVKYWRTTPPACDHPFKLEVTFCVRGVLTPPCGVPRLRSIVVPSSCTIGAFSHLSMYSSAHLHVTCFCMARSKSLWSMLSNRPLMSNSSTQSYFHPRSRVTPTASSADFLGL